MAMEALFIGDHVLGRLSETLSAYIDACFISWSGLPISISASNSGKDCEITIVPSEDRKVHTVTNEIEFKNAITDCQPDCIIMDIVSLYLNEYKISDGADFLIVNADSVVIRERVVSALHKIVGLVRGALSKKRVKLFLLCYYTCETIVENGAESFIVDFEIARNRNTALEALYRRILLVKDIQCVKIPRAITFSSSYAPCGPWYLNPSDEFYVVAAGEIIRSIRPKFYQSVVSREIRMLGLRHRS